MAPRRIKKKGVDSESETEDIFSDVSDISDVDEIIEELSDNDKDIESSSDEDEKILEYNEANVASESEFKEDGIKDEEEEECYYYYAQNGQLIEDDNIIENIKKNPKQVPNDERMTTKKLTKYELVPILGDRAKQISLNAKVMIKNIETKNPLEIAIEELKAGVLPLKIRRHLPDGSFEEWKLSELEIDLDML